MATVGSIAWYTHLYGSVPFLGEVKANSPAEVGLHPASYPWNHNGYFDTFDHARCAAFHCFGPDTFGKLTPSRRLFSRPFLTRRPYLSMDLSLLVSLCLGSHASRRNLRISQNDELNEITVFDVGFKSTAKYAQHATRSTGSHGVTSSASRTQRTRRAYRPKKSSTRMARMTRARISSARASSATTSRRRTRIKRPRVRAMGGHYPRI